MIDDTVVYYVLYKYVALLIKFSTTIVYTYDMNYRYKT